MRLELPQLWNKISHSLLGSSRRRRPIPAAFENSESLETRNFLSSGMGGASLAAHVQTHAPAHAVEKATTVPDVSGTYDMVTHLEGLELHGVMVLEQNGKKVTGTLTNDLQPPGSVKLKIVSSGAVGASRADGSTLRGKILNYALASKRTAVALTILAGFADGRFHTTKAGDTLFSGNKR